MMPKSRRERFLVPVGRRGIGSRAVAEAEPGASPPPADLGESRGESGGQSTGAGADDT
jgi:hypothetical protein